MRQRALVREPIGERQILGVVGDGHVLVAALPSGFCHFFDRVAAVGFNSVHVHIAADVAQFDQHGQRVRCGGFDFSLILTQLSGDEVEIQLGVNLFFGFACHRLLVFKARQTIFVQRETHLQRALPQGHVVRLRAGEILHRRSK